MIEDDVTHVPTQDALELPPGPDPPADAMGVALEKPSTVHVNAVKAPPSAHPRQLAGWMRVAREVLAIGLWLGGTLKLFVFDVDRWLLERYLPSAVWIAHYRFAFVLAAVGLLALFWRRHFLWRWAGYLLFYPFIILLWRVPAYVVKRRSWALGVVLVAIGVNAVRSLRSTILLVCTFLLGTVLCFYGKSAWSLVPGSGLLVTALLLMYWRVLQATFRRGLSAFSAKALERTWGVLRKVFDQSASSAVRPEDMTPSERETWATNLQMAVIYNRACYFLAEKLRGLARSNINAGIGVARLVGLFVATVWIFYLLNLSVYRAGHDNFMAGHPLSRFDIFYYSFRTLFAGDVSGIAPISTLARMLAVAAIAWMGLIFMVVVVFVVTSLHRAEDERRMEAAVVAIQEHATAMEPYIDQRFGMDIPQAVVALRQVRAGVVEIIYYLSPALRPPPEQGGDKVK